MDNRIVNTIPLCRDCHHKATYRTTREQVFRRYGRVCVHCGAPATEIDYLLPIADGGDDSLANLRPSCARCNRGRR